MWVPIQVYIMQERHEGGKDLTLWARLSGLVVWASRLLQRAITCNHVCRCIARYWFLWTTMLYYVIIIMIIYIFMIWFPISLVPVEKDYSASSRKRNEKSSRFPTSIFVESAPVRSFYRANNIIYNDIFWGGKIVRFRSNRMHR